MSKTRVHAKSESEGFSAHARSRGRLLAPRTRIVQDVGKILFKLCEKLGERVFPFICGDMVESNYKSIQGFRRDGGYSMR